MEIRTSNGLIENLLAQRLLVQPEQQRAPASQPQRQARTGGKDIISLSGATLPSGTNSAKLINEIEQKTDTGIRLIQEFETADRRTFTRIQDFTTTERGFRRDVIQQNPSGSTTRLEDILNRQDNGFFQRIQTFTDEVGITATRIDDNIPPAIPFRANGTPNTPFEITRGTQLDIQA